MNYPNPLKTLLAVLLMATLALPPVAAAVGDRCSPENLQTYALLCHTEGREGYCLMANECLPTCGEGEGGFTKGGPCKMTATDEMPVTPTTAPVVSDGGDSGGGGGGGGAGVAVAVGAVGLGILALNLMKAPVPFGLSPDIYGTEEGWTTGFSFAHGGLSGAVSETDGEVRGNVRYRWEWRF